MEIREYVRAQSLQQAYELNRRRDSRILGAGCGSGWTAGPSAPPLTSAGWGLTVSGRGRKRSPSGP